MLLSKALLVAGVVTLCGIFAADALEPVPGWENVNDLGQTPEMKYTPAEFLGKSIMTFKSPGIFKGFIDGFEQVFLINCSEIARLITQEHELVEAHWPNTLKGLLREKSLIFSKGWTKWGRTRALVEASVTPTILSSLVPQIAKRVTAYTSKWSTSTTPVSLFPETRALVFDTMLSILFGKTFTDAEYTTYHDLYSVLDDGSLTVTLDTPLTTWGKALRADRRLRAFMQVHILEKIDGISRGAPANEPSIIGALLQAMLDEGVDVEDLILEEITDIAVTYFFGSYVTVSQTIARILWEVPVLPAFLSKVKDEQASLIGKYGPALSLEVLDQMPFADALIKESFRIQPPVGAVYRQALRDQEIGGRLVKKGQIILFLIAASCNNPTNFPNTNAADTTIYLPDRWIQSAPTTGCPSAVPIPAKMMPFGGGPRQCPARYFATSIIKTTLGLIVRSATWTRAAEIKPYVHPDTAKLAKVVFVGRGFPAQRQKVCPGMGFWPKAPGSPSDEAAMPNQGGAYPQL